MKKQTVLKSKSIRKRADIEPIKIGKNRYVWLNYPTMITEINNVESELYSSSDSTCPPCIVLKYNTNNTTNNGQYIPSLIEFSKLLFRYNNGKDYAKLTSHMYDVARELDLEILHLNNAIVFISKSLHDSIKLHSVNTHTKTNCKEIIAKELLKVSTDVNTWLNNIIDFGISIYNNEIYCEKMKAIVSYIQDIRLMGTDMEHHKLSVRDVDKLLRLIEVSWMLDESF